MLTKKDWLKITLCIFAGFLLVLGLVWILTQLAPLLIGAIAFILWLGAALCDGAKV